MRSSDGSITDLGDGRQRIRITIGYDPKTGKQIRADRTIRATPEEAEVVFEDMKREFGTAEAYVYGRMPVAKFVREEYLPTREPLAETTKRGYNATMRNHIDPLFGKMKMKDATKHNLERTLLQIEKPGARLNAFKLLHGAFGLAFDSGYLSVNPMAKMKKPKLPRYSADVYDLEETLDVLDVFRGSVIEPGVIIMATCGPRISEVCALNWTDLVLERKVITHEDGNREVVFRGEFHIDDSYHRLTGRRITKDTKTESSDRYLGIPGFAVERLMEIRGAGRIGPLMVDAKGLRMTPDGYTSRWRRMLLPRYNKRGKLIYEPPMRYIEAKNLRHSETTILLDEGATYRAVAARQGHVREFTTRDIYDRAKKVADHSTAEIMDRAAARVRGEKRDLARPKSG